MTNAAVDICFVIVSYHEEFYSAVSFKTLCEALEATKDWTYKILVYDNSDAEGWNVNYSSLKNADRIFYYHDAKNSGLGVAYNFMAKQAAAMGAKWMVLFDQDTALPKDAAILYRQAIQSDNGILLKVPTVFVGDAVFSPLRHFFVKTFQAKDIEAGNYPLANYLVINSGMLIHLDLFWSVNGYNEAVKLDFSDVDFIRRIREKIQQFEVLPIKCQQTFSLQVTSDVAVALKRYQSYLNDHYQCERKTFLDWIRYHLINLIHLRRLLKKYRSSQFVKMYLKFVMTKKTSV